MSRSPTTTKRDELRNPHAGELLVSEFMQPLGLEAASLAVAIDIPTDRLQAVLRGTIAIDAELDLRLSRYFVVSEGFFMRLQIQYELMEAKRALNGKLDRIVPRAA